MLKLKGREARNLRCIRKILRARVSQDTNNELNALTVVFIQHDHVRKKLHDRASYACCYQTFEGLLFLVNSYGCISLAKSDSITQTIVFDIARYI